MSQQLKNAKDDRSKPRCHHCGKPGHYRNQCRLLKNQIEESENNQNNPGNKNSDANNYIPHNNTNNNDHNNFKNSNRAETKPETVHPPCETCGKTNHSAERCYVGANAANRPLPWKWKPEEQSGHFQQDAQNSITGCVRATTQYLNYKCHIFAPELWVRDRRPPEENSSNPSCCLAAISGDICG